jgi:hypothetical protein
VSIYLLLRSLNQRMGGAGRRSLLELEAGGRSNIEDEAQKYLTMPQ